MSNFFIALAVADTLFIVAGYSSSFCACSLFFKAEGTFVNVLINLQRGRSHWKYLIKNGVSGQGE